MLKKVMMSVPAMFVASVAFAADAPAGGGMSDHAVLGFAAFLALGIAAFGGALAQGRAAAAALEGIARNPGAADKLFVPFILALALIESLVIYALLIAFLKV